MLPEHPVIFAESHIILQILIINVAENTIGRHGNIDIPLINATAVSDFEKANHAIIRVQPSAMLESTEITFKYSLTFDDLHQNALPGILVPQ